MKFKGTKGKWYFYRKTDQHKIEEIRTKDMQSICDMPIFQEESEANAKLIASAPEMFEMLNNIYEKGFDINQKDRNEIFELLTKITQ